MIMNKLQWFWNKINEVSTAFIFLALWYVFAPFMQKLGYAVGGGTDSIRIYDDNAGSSIAEFEEGGDVTIAQGCYAGNFYISSDELLKENIQPIQNGLDKALMINPISFRFKESKKESIGFTAQNVQLVAPELVSKDKNGYLKLSYQQITAINNAAIHELSNKVKSNEATIKELKEEIRMLKEIIKKD